MVGAKCALSRNKRLTRLLCGKGRTGMNHSGCADRWTDLGDGSGEPLTERCMERDCIDANRLAVLAARRIPERFMGENRSWSRSAGALRHCEDDLVDESDDANSTNRTR
eukprot:3716007-Rhodomonas_salina.1